MELSLGPDQVRIAKVVGSARYQSCRAAGSKDVHYEHDASAEFQDHNAAGAEIAVCVALGAWWEATSAKGSENKEADVRRGEETFQVRWSKYPRGFLPLYPDDNNEDVFIFVTGSLPTFRVVGFIKANEVKDSAHWSEVNPRNGQRLFCPCYLIEQKELVDIEQL